MHARTPLDAASEAGEWLTARALLDASLAPSLPERAADARRVRSVQARSHGAFHARATRALALQRDRLGRASAAMLGELLGSAETTLRAVCSATAALGPSSARGRTTREARAAAVGALLFCEGCDGVLSLGALRPTREHARRPPHRLPRPILPRLQHLLERAPKLQALRRWCL